LFYSKAVKFYSKNLLELVEALRVSVEEALDVDVSAVAVEILFELDEGWVGGQGPTSVHVEGRNYGSNFRRLKNKRVPHS